MQKNSYRSSLQGYLIGVVSLLCSSYTLASTCESEVSLDETVNGSWSSECVSSNRVSYDPYNPVDYYSKFYTFTITETKDISVNIYGGYDRELYLLNGSGNSRDIKLGQQGSLIETSLPAGTYTIEATSPSLNDFTLELSELRYGTNQCISEINLGDTISDGWVAECQSVQYQNDDPYADPALPTRAKYFSFNLNEPTDVSVSVQTPYGVPTHLNMIEGDNEYGTVVDSSSYSNSLNTFLPMGVYTLELAAMETDKPSSFSVTINGVSSSICSETLDIQDGYSSFNGNWSPNCEIRSEPVWDNGDPYNTVNPERANYYTISLAQPKDIKISRDYSDNKLLFNLYEGNTLSNPIYLNVEKDYVWETDREMWMNLEVGDYTLEVTRFNERAIGSYNFYLEATTQESCIQNIEDNFYETQNLNVRCESLFRGKGLNDDPYNGGGQPGTYFAKQLKFTLEEQKEVSFSGSSYEYYRDIFLYIAELKNDELVKIDYSQESDYGYGNKYRLLKRSLPAGDYLVEVTSSEPSYFDNLQVNTTVEFYDSQFNQSCHEYVELDKTTSLQLNAANVYDFELDSQCLSTHKPREYNYDPYNDNGGSYYRNYNAQHITFEVNEAKDYSIKLNASGFMPDVFLMTGSRKFGDSISDTSSMENGLMVTYLEPGFYTLEVTSQEVESVGDFDLLIASEDLTQTPPVISVNQEFSIKESAEIGEIVGQLEFNSAFTVERFEVSGTDSLKVNQNGEIELTRKLDYEYMPRVTFWVVAHDSNGKSSEQVSVIVKVEDVQGADDKDDENSGSMSWLLLLLGSTLIARRVKK